MERLKQFEHVANEHKNSDQEKLKSMTIKSSQDQQSSKKKKDLELSNIDESKLNLLNSTAKNINDNGSGNLTPTGRHHHNNNNVS